MKPTRKPRNINELSAILERDRAQLVVRYRRNPGPWPDGIDHAANRWYGDGSSWTAERIERALAWPDRVLTGAPALAVVNTSPDVNRPVNTGAVNTSVNKRREAQREAMRRLRARRKGD